MPIVIFGYTLPLSVESSCFINGDSLLKIYRVHRSFQLKESSFLFIGNCQIVISAYESVLEKRDHPQSLGKKYQVYLRAYKGKTASPRSLNSAFFPLLELRLSNSTPTFHSYKSSILSLVVLVIGSYRYPAASFRSIHLFLSPALRFYSGLLPSQVLNTSYTLSLIFGLWAPYPPY